MESQRNFHIPCYTGFLYGSYKHCLLAGTRRMLERRFSFFPHPLYGWKEVGICIENKVLRRIFVLWIQEATRGWNTAVYSLYCTTEGSTEGGQGGQVTEKVMISVRNIRRHCWQYETTSENTEILTPIFFSNHEDNYREIYIHYGHILNKVEIICNEVTFIINTHFPRLRLTLCAGRLKIFVSALCYRSPVCISPPLTLILLMWRIGWAHNNARK